MKERGPSAWDARKAWEQAANTRRDRRETSLKDKGSGPASASEATTDNRDAGARPAAPAAAAADKAALPHPGMRVGNYELIGELGRGALGAVYLARDTKLGRRMAMKFLYSTNPELNARFIIEARATARANHENIVVIHEVDEHRGIPFMALEFVPGRPLSAFVGQGRRMPPRRAVELMLPVVRALEHAHQHNIVHHDLKPDNIFVTDSGAVKVLDFGIAKLIQEGHRRAAPGSPALPLSRTLEFPMVGEDDASDPNRSGAIVGTLPYMSPEQWGADLADHRSDIWAVGILLYTMVAGQHPLAPLSGWELSVTAVLEEPMPRARRLCPEIPEELATLIDRCLVKAKAERLASARLLREALERISVGLGQPYAPSAQTHEPPYPGLRSFQEQDAIRFFGRGREIAAAKTRLHSHPLVAVVGPSGVGKSSFVRAGLVPALKHSGEAWSALIARPGRQPVAALAQLIAPMIGDSSSRSRLPTAAGGASVHPAVQRRLYSEPGYLGVILRSRARRSGEKILLFIDQFEELYTLVPDRGERAAFTRCLASVGDDVSSPLRLVISIRSDFLDRVGEDEQFLADLARGLFFLPALDRAALRDALVLPAEMAGYQFESEDIVEHMVAHLEHLPGALPRLQFAASRLWQMRDRSQNLLTADNYAQLGPVAGALASHADAVVVGLPPPSQSRARALFLRLVTPERTRAIAAMSELDSLSPQAGEVEQLVAHLVQARLLVVQTGDAAGAASIELAHESLVHTWPLLRRWLDENQKDADFFDQLRRAAREWQARGRPRALLWQGEALEEAKLWYRRYRGELPAEEASFLRATFALEAGSVQRRRVAVAGVIGLLSLCVVAAAAALFVIRDAQNEASARAREAGRQLVLAQQEKGLAHDAREKAVRASAHLARKNQELINAVTAAEDARAAAERARLSAEEAKQRARRDRRRAERKEREARRAEAQAQEAERRLGLKLEEERKRLEEIDRQRARGVNVLIPDVEIESHLDPPWSR